VNTALVVIDVQRDILAVPGAARQAVGERFAQVLRVLAGLIEKARAAGAPVIFVQHDGPEGHRLATGKPGWELHPDLPRREDDLVIRKTACDAFYETSLEPALLARGITRAVITGLMTQYCVDTTCRRAVSLGFDVTLVADAHTTADSEHLQVEQIVAHHNALLNGLDAGAAEITVMPAAVVSFG
jgi:nicotinamidase-related amidase